MGLIDQKQVDKTDWNDNTYIDGLGNDPDIDIFNPLQPTTYIVINKRKPPYGYVVHFDSSTTADLSQKIIDGRDHKVVIANLDSSPVEVEGYLSANEIAEESIFREDWGTIMIQPGQVMTIRYYWVLLNVRHCIVDYVIT